MSKFIVVKEAPKTLEKGEIVIGQPDFMEQIVANTKKAPKRKQTAVNHLREVLGAIGLKYDPTFNVFKVRLVDYTGLPFNDNNDLSAIITKILKKEYAVMFDKVLEHTLKNRPMNTKLIYYVGDFTTSGPFYQAGLDLIQEKEIESYMTGKPPKIVGKPAITDAEAKVTNG